MILSEKISQLHSFKMKLFIPVALNDTSELKDAPISNENTVVKVQSLVQDSDHEARVSNKIHNIVIPNNIFSKIKSSRNQYADTTFPIKPFKNIQIRAIKDKSNDIVLEDTTTHVPIAVCRMMYNGLKPWKIYTLSPNYLGQKASKQVFSYSQANGTVSVALYTYAEMKGSSSNRDHPDLKLILKGHRVCTNSSKKGGNTIDKEKNCTYTATSVGAWKRIVTMNGSQVARMDAKSTSNRSNSTITSLKVIPNTDPCLMVCISAICSYIDENTVRE